MSRKCKIGVFAFLAAVVLVIILSGGYLLTLGGVFHPTVNLKGGNITLELNETYEEPGFKARSMFHDVSDQVTVSGDVDTSKTGVYTIVYEIKGTTKTRKVTVQDTTPPQITLLGNSEIHVFERETFNDPGVEIIDASCDDGQSLLQIEGNVDMLTCGEYELIYKAVDASGNTSSVSRKIIVEADPALVKLHYAYDVYDNTAFEWWFNKSENHQRMEGAIVQVILDKYAAYYLGPDDKVIYLTFDEGGNDITYIHEIADVLNAHDIKATFFLTRNYVIDNEEFMRSLVDQGHLIGNHTRHHYDMPTLANEAQIDQFVLEVLDCEKAIQQVTGTKPVKVFRFPKGATSERAMKIVSDLGYRSYFWSHAYYDYGPDISKEEAYNTLVEHLHNGAIYLLHPSNKGNYLAMEDFITEAQRQGYRFALVSEIE